MECGSSKQEEKRKRCSTRVKKLWRVFTDTEVWWVWVVGGLTQECTASGICMTGGTVMKRELRWREKFKRKQTPGAKNACSVDGKKLDVQSSRRSVTDSGRAFPEPLVYMQRDGWCRVYRPPPRFSHDMLSPSFWFGGFGPPGGPPGNIVTVLSCPIFGRPGWKLLNVGLGIVSIFAV